MTEEEIMWLSGGNGEAVTVRVNTSDVEWLKRHGHGLEGPVAYGTDVRGVMYFTGRSRSRPWSVSSSQART